MPDLIAPNGSPLWVPRGEENAYIKIGYRPTPTTVEVTPVPHAVEVAKQENPEPIRVNVNSADLKALSSLPKLTTAIARTTITNRPYESVPDLIEKVPGFDWLAIESRLEF